jgi:hypothetical protein
MRIVNNHRNDEDDSMWSLVAEAVLRDGAVLKDVDNSHSAGSVIESMRKFGLSLETLNSMEGIIAGVARESISENKAGRPTLPVCVQLFCQRKSTYDPVHPEDPMEGGWGFYAIERGRNDPNVCFQEYARIIELYVYREKPA